MRKKLIKLYFRFRPDKYGVSLGELVTILIKRGEIELFGNNLDGDPIKYLELKKINDEEIAILLEDYGKRKTF